MPIALYGPIDIDDVDEMRAVVMRSPTHTNSIGINTKVNHAQSISGRHYTYIRKASEHRIVYTFEALNYDKYRELDEFYQFMGGREFRLYDYNLEVWRVRFKTSDLAFTTQDGSTQSIDCERSREFGSLTLELIGTKYA